MVPDDLQLWRGWRDGDAASGNELVQRHFTSIFRFFRGKVPAHADELTQQTFLACIEAKDRFRDGNSFRSYLFGIAR
ncbi:MAG: sigma factor, partial [Myxococcota bacterium]